MSDLRIRPDRRKHVAKLVKRVGLLDDDSLSEDARVLYVLAALVADKDGHMPQERLRRAALNPHLQQAAIGLLAAVRHSRGQ